MRKGLCLLICLVVLTAAVFAAGSREAAATGEEHYTLTWMTQGAVPDGRTATVAYVEDKFNVTFEFIQGLNYWEWLNLALAANDMPDLVGEVRGSGMPDVKEYGLATFTLDELKTHMPRYWRYLQPWSADWEGYLKSVGTSKGEINTIPSTWETAAYPQGYLWRKDRLDQLGVGVPTTIAEAERAFELFKKQWPNEYPYTTMCAKQWSFSSYLAFGAYGIHPGHTIFEDPALFRSELSARGTAALAPWLNGSRVLVPGFVHPRAKAALEVLARWYAKGYIDPEFATYSLLNNREYFHSGKGLVDSWNGGRPTDDYVVQQFKQRGLEVGKDVVLAAGPGLRTQYANVKPKHNAYPANIIGAGGGIGFGKHVEQDRGKMYRMFEMLDALKMDPVDAIRVYWGIEGTHWKWDATKTYREWIAPYANGSPDSQKEGLGYMMIPTNTFPEAQRFDQATVERKQQLDLYHGPGKVNDWSVATANDDHLFGRIPPGKQLLDANGERMVMPDVAWDSVFTAIIIGQQPLSAFDDFVDRWYAQGGDKVVRATNEQFLGYWLNWKP